MRNLRRFRNAILDILFPPLCAACQSHLDAAERLSYLCRRCLASLTKYETLFCSVCGARLPDKIKICHQQSSYLLGAATSYADDIARALIWNLKYERIRAAALPIAQILASYVESLRLADGKTIIVPIPLHEIRKRQRGFNQSELIAEHLSQQTKIPLMPQALSRIKNTAPQADLRDQEAREQNVQDCFAAHSEALPKNIDTVIIVDDVSTTGATLREAAAALKASGIRKIIGLVFARAH